MSPENRTPKHRAENTINIDVTSTEFKIPVLVEDEPAGDPSGALGLKQERYSRRQDDYNQQYLNQGDSANEVSAPVVASETTSEIVADLTSKALEQATGAQDLLNVPLPQQSADYLPPYFTPISNSKELPPRK